MSNLDFNGGITVPFALLMLSLTVVAIAALYFVYQARNAPRAPAFIWLIVVAVIAVVAAVVILVLTVNNRLEQDATASNAQVTVQSNYICTGEPATISWRTDLSSCSAAHCATAGSCSASSDCLANVQVCIDNVCQWRSDDVVAGGNPCDMGCPRPIVMGITASPTTAVTNNPIVVGDTRQAGSVEIIPQSNVRLLIDPDGPARALYYSITENISVIGASTPTSVTANLVCNDNPDNRDMFKWRLALDGGTASDGIIVSVLANGSSGRGFDFTFPDGAGGEFMRSVAGGGVISAIRAQANVGEDIYANDNPPMIGSLECSSSAPGTTAPGSAPTTSRPALPVDVTFSCLP